MGGASAIKIRVSKNEVKQPPPTKQYGSKVATSELQLHEVQDLADHVDALREATAGHPLRIRVTVEVGENSQVDQAVLDKVNSVLAESGINRGVIDRTRQQHGTNRKPQIQH